jgi:hypothetical protein
LKKAVVQSDLVDFAARILSKTTDGLNAALGQLKDNIASLPVRKEYLELSAEEQSEVEHASLIFAFLEKSPGCKEVFDEMEEVHPSTNMFMILAELLHLILENNYFLRTIGSNFTLCKQIVRNLVPKMNSLFETVKAGPSMASLLLLRTVAKTSQSAATDLVGALNLATFGGLFSHGIVHLKKTHQELSAVWDEPMEEVRVYAAKVVFALLRTADTRLKDFVMGRDEKNARFVSLAFSRLTTYNRATVLEALDVLRNHVLRDRSLMRRVKTAFFSSQLLGDLGMLVHRFHDERVIEFVEYIVTDHYNGVVIPEEVWVPEDHGNKADDEDGEDQPQHAQKKPQQSITWSSNVRFLGLLNALRPWRSVVQRDLVMLVLAECPRLAPLYFGQGPDNHFCAQFFPKSCSSSWLCSMALVKKYVQEVAVPQPSPWISEARAVELAERAVPGSPSLVQWRKCLASDYGLVRLASLDTLHAILVRLHQQLDRRNRLCVMALDWIQTHRLPNVNLLQLLVAREKADCKNPGSDLVLGAALRCLNLYHEIFSETQISDSNWVGSLQSPWSRVPAIGLIAYTSHGWWQRGPAKDVFKMLVVDKSAKNSLLRKAVSRTAQSLLQDTDLFGNALFGGELDQWLHGIEAEADADLLVSSIGRIMKAVPTAKHLEAKFNQELRKYASPLLLEVCGHLYQKSPTSCISKFRYLCRVILSLCHAGVVPIRLLLELLEVLRKDDVLFSGSAHAEGGAVALQVVSATSRFVEFLSSPSLKVSAAKSPHDEGLRDVPGSMLPPCWWNDVALLGDLSAGVILAHLVFLSAPSQPLCLAEDRLVELADERLFCQAFYYVEHVRKLAGSATEALCFRVMWAALEREGVVSVEQRQRILLNSTVLEACLASSCVEAVALIGECLIFAENHSVVGSVLVQAKFLARAAPLLHHLRWNQVEPLLVNDLLRRLLAGGEWRLASLVVWSAWPGVSCISDAWLAGFWERATLPIAVAGSHNVAPPMLETVVVAMESLRKTRELDRVVLFWALLGVVEEPAADLVVVLARVAASAATAVCALLAVYARLYTRVAQQLNQMVLGRDRSVLAGLVPAVCFASRSVSKDRHGASDVAVVRAAVSGSLPSVWVVQWMEKVCPIDKAAFVQGLNGLDIKSLSLASNHRLVSMSNLSYEEKLRLLLPVVSVAEDVLPEGSWKAVASCLRELKHVSQWGPDDVSLQVLRVALAYPCRAGFEALADAVLDERTDAGWVERACRELLSNADCQHVSMAELLLVMMQRRPNLCTRDCLGRILSFYSCSCSRVDLVLLKIIRVCQRNGVELEAAGSVWGRMEEMSIGGGGGGGGGGGVEHLFYEGGLIKDAMLMNSIADFPVERLESEPMEDDCPGIYDPCFLLPYLYRALTKFEANCKRFADRGFLAYALMGCSSAHEEVRRHAYSVIQAYWVLLEVSPSFSWKPQIRLLISSFKNAIVRPLQFVPSVVTVFLAHFALILCQPSHFMYEMINNALLRRPVMELGTVPLLRDAFLGKCEGTVRKWWLQTLVNGAKRGVDLKLLQEFHVVELLLSFFHHVADVEERILILKLLHNCTRNPHLARMLDGKFGVLSWLAASGHSILERGAAARVATGLLSGYAKDAAPTATRQQGWALGMALLARATSRETARSALALLAATESAVSNADDVARIVSLSRTLSEPETVLAAVAAARGCGVDGAETLLELLLETWPKLGSSVRVAALRHLCAALVADETKKVGVVVERCAAGLRRLGCALLLGGICDAKERSAAGALACLVVRQRRRSGGSLEKEFEAALARSDVDEMLLVMTRSLHNTN